MAAGDEQQQIGESEIRVAQHRRKRMAFEMVDRDQRLARRQRQPLGGDQADHHAADQPRPGGRGDRVDLAERDTRLGQRFLDQARQDLDMGARRDLRNDAAKGAMRRFLPGETMGEDAPVRADQGRRRLVAARFDAEDQAHRRLPCHCLSR